MLHDALARSARLHPRRAAVSLRGRTLTYAELDARSDRLAAALACRGVRRGTRVALLSRKSLEAAVAVFAVLKAGAAYVPLDPLDPPERTRLKLARCAPAALIAQPERCAALRASAGGLPKTVILTDDADARARLPGTLSWSQALSEAAPPPRAAARPGEPAYLLFTSGSTGEPKAVTISHAAAENFVDWAVREFSLRPSDRLAGCAPLHFDLSVLDLFGGAAAGAAVVMVPEEAWAFPAELAALVARERLTVWYSVPSALVQLLGPGGLSRRTPNRLRAVLFAGEVFPLPALRRLAAALPRARLYNLYGPTETNVCAMQRVTPALLSSGLPVPIGSACAGMSLAVAAEGGRSARPGETGMLFARGPSLMSGYWGRGPRETPSLARRALGGARRPALWYETGDLVIPDEAGRLTFVGRRDDLVKARGYRVSLLEVEAALAACPGVAEAAAVLAPGLDGGTLLAAVRASSARRDPAAWSRALSEKLPPYMIPRLVAWRRALPRTSTGKVDRKELLRRLTEDRCQETSSR